MPKRRRPRRRSLIPGWKALLWLGILLALSIGSYMMLSATTRFERIPPPERQPAPQAS